MPTDAFYNLNHDRKDKLLNAAVQEFSKHPYAKVSVFKIAQKAEISRSNFYYYFRDKEDIYKYLIYEVKEDFMQGLGELKEPFDLFWFAEKVFDYIASIKGTDLESFFSNLVDNVTPESINMLFDNFNSGHVDRRVQGLCELDELNVKDDKELREVIFMLSSSIMFSIGGYLSDNITLSEAKQKQQRMSNIIKNGVLKRSEE